MRRVLLALCVAAVAAAVVPLAAGRGAARPADAPGELLPDLAQLVPSAISVRRTSAGQVHLGFAGVTANVGAGELVVRGTRASLREPLLRADQLVRRADGSTRVVRSIDALRYVHQADHQHWHLTGFAHYELRSVGGTRLVGRDRKTGFCLGDRIPAALPDGRRAGPARHETDCGEGRPRALRLVEGITPGHADIYKAHIEGQSIDVTGLPSGRYLLVQRVNAEQRIAESSYTNDVSSALLSLRWREDRSRMPVVRALLRCPSSGVCRPAA